MVQICSGKTETSLKEKVLVAYKIHAVLLKFSLHKRQYLVDKEYKLIAFIPVGTYGTIQE